MAFNLDRDARFEHTACASYGQQFEQPNNLRLPEELVSNYTTVLGLEPPHKWIQMCLRRARAPLMDSYAHLPIPT